MRLFQNSGFYRGYRPRLNQICADCETFAQRIEVFLGDRYSACHILQPVLQGDQAAFFTNGDDVALQKMWAREHGMPSSASLHSILMSQIEEHRSEVFYNLDPVRFDKKFVSRLPSCVKAKIAWRAAPSRGADFGSYDRIVCNFPSILRAFELQGFRTAYFSPAHDPVMDGFASNKHRHIDVLFVGGFSRHHARRTELLNAVASIGKYHKVAFHLETSRLTRLAESAIGKVLPLSRYRRPRCIFEFSRESVYGLDLYRALSNAKVVINGAIDMAGSDRGNMRCWEAMGCGALMLSDEGIYPPGMKPGYDFETYIDSSDALRKVLKILLTPEDSQVIARNGHETMSRLFSKDSQWALFRDIVDAI